jgi:hypothetical protein
MSFKTLVFSILTVAALVACDKSRSGVTGTLSGGGQPQLGSAGTMDSGGCNGFDKGCLESYAVDITTLPEYQKVVKPIGEKMFALESQADSNKDDMNALRQDGITDDWHLFAKMKTWYFVPTNLSQIPSKRLGVAFATEQLALQSKKEIWIDAEKYHALSEQARGELLLHELVMSAYLARKGSYSDFIQSISTFAPDYAAFLKTSKAALSASDDYQKISDQVNGIPTSTFTGLTKQDYEKIRGMTRFLIENGATMSGQQFVQAQMTFDGGPADNVAADAGFSKEAKELHSFDMNSVKMVLSLSEKSGNKPVKCLVQGSTTETQCSLEWKMSQVTSSQTAPILEVSVSYQNEQGATITQTFKALALEDSHGINYQTIDGIRGSFVLHFQGLQNDNGVFDKVILNITNSGGEVAPQYQLVGFSLSSAICEVDSAKSYDCVVNKNNPPVEAAISDAQFSKKDLIGYLMSVKTPNYLIHY